MSAAPHAALSSTPLELDGERTAKLIPALAIALSAFALFALQLPLLGYPLGAVQFIRLCGILLLIAVGLTGMSFFVAWRSESTQGFHAIMNLVFIPMWLLSGAVFPADGAAGWIRGVREGKIGIQRRISFRAGPFFVPGSG